MVKSEESAESTQHHYTFAHQALRAYCEGDPLGFFEIMASETKVPFVEAIWKSVCEQCEGEPPFSIDDVIVEPLRLENFPAILVTMPPPSRRAEAYFVAMVLKAAIEAEAPPEQPEFDCYTLEKRVDVDGTEGTVLGCWTENVHLNFGEGPEANRDDFLQAVLEKIETGESRLPPSFKNDPCHVKKTP